jgi:2-methylisocitrate lyase-like PEP mutase family enzyme
MVAEKAAAGKLEDLTIPEMKCFLKDRKLAVSGKKADLIARIRATMEASKASDVV